MPSREQRLRYPKQIAEQKKRYYKRYPEKRAELNRRYKENNRDVIRHNNRRAKSRRRGAEGSHTKEQFENIKKNQNYTCLHCNKREPEITLTEDHIIPIIKKGTDYIENIQALCHSCNAKKGAS